MEFVCREDDLRDRRGTLVQAPDGYARPIGVALRLDLYAGLSCAGVDAAPLTAGYDDAVQAFHLSQGIRHACFVFTGGGSRNPFPNFIGV